MGWSSDLGSDLAQASIPSRLQPAQKHFRWALSTSSSWRQLGSRLKPTDLELGHRSSSSVRKTKSCVPFGNPLVEQDLVRRRRNGIKLFDFAQPTARSMKPDRGGMLAADGRQSLFVRRPLAAQVVNRLRRTCPCLSFVKGSCIRRPLRFRRRRRAERESVLTFAGTPSASTFVFRDAVLFIQLVVHVFDELLVFNCH